MHQRKEGQAYDWDNSSSAEVARNQTLGPGPPPRPRPRAPAPAPRAAPGRRIARAAAVAGRRGGGPGAGAGGGGDPARARPADERGPLLAGKGGRGAGMAWTNEVEYHRAKAQRRAARAAGPPRQPASLSGHTSPLRFAVVAGWRPFVASAPHILCVGDSRCF